METIVGIDLGTTNSAISVLVEGNADIIEIDGAPSMPSCVGIDAAGNLLVGRSALNQYVAAPESTVLSIKRSMGEDKKVSLGDKEFTPEEISSLILRKLKDCAKQHLGKDIEKAVITVPAYFNDRQRKATQDAGVLAGLDVVRIINEPTAASIAYETNVEKDERILVYDLGGGTFDVSLVVVENEVVEVKSSHGDTHLGGDDFDNILVDHVVSKFKEEHNIDLSEDLRSQSRLKIIMENAKRVLSDESFVKIHEEFITDDLHLEIEITRDEYEGMIHPLLEKTLECLHQCLRDTSMLPNAIDKVMLVGGSTRTPLVHKMIKSAMNIEPRFEINPDLIVAMGAGMQGGIISGLETNSILVDITPFSFGTSAIEEYNGEIRHDMFVPIITRNTPIPAKKSEMFYTMVDNQQCVEVSVYQGEETFVGDNLSIGRFLIEGLSNAPANNPIIMDLDLDINGMLKVTAIEKVTGLAKCVVMDTKNVKKNFDIDDAKKNIKALLGNSSDIDGDVEVKDISESSGNEELLKKSEELKQRADKLLSSSIDEDDAKEIKELVEKIDNAINEEDWETLATVNESLSDMVFYMED